MPLPPDLYLLPASQKADLEAKLARADADHQRAVDNEAAIAQAQAEAEAQLAALRGAVIAKDVGDYVTLNAIAPATVTDSTVPLIVGGRTYTIAIATLGGI